MELRHEMSQCPMTITLKGLFLIVGLALAGEPTRTLA